MSPTELHNHTPIDFHRLKNQYSHVPSPKKGFAMPKNLSNIFLIGSVVVFIVAISYSVNVSQNQSNTRASVISPSPTPPRFPSKIAVALGQSKLKPQSNYPKTYNKKDIPTSVFTQAQQKYASSPNQDKIKQYIIDRVEKYYIYTDALTENNIIKDTPGDATFNEMENKIPVLEKQVREELVTSMDFNYLTAWFAGAPNQKEMEKKFGTDVKTKAADVLDSYRAQLIKTNASPEDIFNKAKKDDDLDVLNNHSIGLIKGKERYSADDDLLTELNLPGKSDEFNQFLFNLTTETPSKIHTLGTEQNENVYIFIYPTKIRTNKYESLATLYEEKSSLFTY